MQKWYKKTFNLKKNLISLIPFIFLCALIVCVTGCSSEPEKRVPSVDTIMISGMKFMPEELTVQKGDTVVFLNNDMVVHDITQQPDKAWNSSKLNPGQSYKMVVRAGADYNCSIHPTMKGRLIVQ